MGALFFVPTAGRGGLSTSLHAETRFEHLAAIKKESTDAIDAQTTMKAYSQTSRHVQES